MDEHEQLRGALLTLTADQPVPVDRVGEVRGRIRRRARRKVAGATSLVLVAGVGAAVLLSPGAGSEQTLRPALPAVSASPAPSPRPVRDATPRELAVTISEAYVWLPGRSYAEQVRRVQARLDVVPHLPSSILRRTTDFDFTPAPEKGEVGVHVIFFGRLTPEQQGQLDLVAPGGVASIGDAAGWDLELVAPLSPSLPQARARALAENRFSKADVEALMDPLDGTMELRADAADQLVVHYVGLPLSTAHLRAARAAAARVAGADADQVHLRRGRE